MAEIDQIAKDIVVAWLSHTNVPFDFEEPAQTGPTPLLHWWGIKPGAPRSKPRHNFVYLSTDQYFSQKSGSQAGNGAIVTKLFISGAGFFQAVPLG
jgi:hypothetical protein